MAEDLTVERPMTLHEPPKRAPRRFVHGRRFAIAYALLALALAGAGALLYAAFQMETEADRQWSSWQPTSEEGTDQLSEIANHVARRYADGGSALPFQAIPGPPEARVRSGPGGETQTIGLDAAVFVGNENAVRLNTAVAYSLCGRGENCQVTPAAVDREFGASLNGALEMALYTFKYVDDVESVLFFLPPVPNTGAEGGDDGLLETVVFFRRDDLKTQLDEPLDTVVLNTSGQVGNEAGELLRSHLYTFEYDVTPQGLSLLKLTPYGAG